MIRRTIIALSILLTAFLARQDLARAAPREWILGSTAPAGSPAAETVEQVGHLLEAISGGRIKIKYRMGGILGDEPDVIRLCQRGQIQVFAGSLSALVSLTPELRALETPYLFPDPEAYLKVASVLEHGNHPTLQALTQRHGIVLLGMGFLGWRSIASVRKPIRTPRDLHQLRVRAMPSDLHPIIWKALGAVPRSFATNELNSALDVDVVEAFDLTTFMLFATNLVDRVRFLTQSRHVPSIAVVAVGAKPWASLSAAAQARLRAGVPAIIARSNQRHVELEEELITLLPGRGVQVITPTPAELAEFKQATRPVEAYVRRTGSKQELELLDLAQRIVRGSSR